MDIQSSQKTEDKMAILSPHLSVMTISVDGLNSPIKRHTVDGWIKNKVQLYGASKILTSFLKTNIG